MPCDDCNGFFGRCEAHSFYCKTCYRMRTARRNVEDSYVGYINWVKSYNKGGYSDKLPMPTRYDYDYTFLYDRVRELENRLMAEQQQQ
jgi:hypothetical protein